LTTNIHTPNPSLFSFAAVGPNELAAPKRTSLLELVAEQFEDRLVQILVVVAIASAVLSLFEDDPAAFVEPLVIVMILVINALVGIWQGRSAEGALDALKKVSTASGKSTEELCNPTQQPPSHTS